jgi:NAD(P)-dependent dehydrogenase (short-subunit alcohol dehydrogenase family)
MGELSTKTALVTGGSRGIGRAIAHALGGRGATVAVGYLKDVVSAEAVVTDLAEEEIVCMAIAADVRTFKGARNLVDATHAAIGPIDILVNNVGEFTLRPLGETSPQKWDDIIASNLNSAFYTTSCVLPSMRARGSGHIVNVGLSAAIGLRAAANIAPYAIAKTGIDILTRSLASEESARGITVNCVAPGLIDNGHLSERETQWMSRRVPAGRLGRPEEVAEAVAFLVSERARYISGATLAVSGGWDWNDRVTDHDVLYATPMDEV